MKNKKCALNGCNGKYYKHLQNHPLCREHYFELRGTTKRLLFESKIVKINPLNMSTNYEKWRSLTEPLASPDNYIDWGLIYLIAASLQRRVWAPPKWRPLYPNLYITLVGKAGVGKGQVIRNISEILNYHKLADAKPSNVAQRPEDQKMINTMIELDLKAAQELEAQGKDKSQPHKDALLIPIAADCVTYEALVQTMSRAIRRINYYDKHPETGELSPKVYSHSSLCFCLEEKSSLFRKNTESLVNFLIQAYDCSENYEYVTKTQGKDRIRRLCLNFLAGTTPSFMAETFDDRLLTQGYSSRSFYIYAAKNRKSVYMLDPLTPEQEQCKKDLIEHVKKLSMLYGEVEIEPETIAWLKSWWKEFEEHPEKRANKSAKMDAYYARLNIHTIKVAMCLHFMESTEMKMGRGVFERAIELLHREEKTMSMALELSGKNPLASASKDILEYIVSNKKATFVDILETVWHKVNKEQCEQALEGLIILNQIYTKNEPDETGEETMYYYPK